MLPAEMKQIMQEYRRLRAVVPLGSLRTKKEYERATELLDAILDEIGQALGDPPQFRVVVTEDQVRRIVAQPLDR